MRKINVRAVCKHCGRVLKVRHARDAWDIWDDYCMKHKERVNVDIPLECEECGTYIYGVLLSCYNSSSKDITLVIDNV